MMAVWPKLPKPSNKNNNKLFAVTDCMFSFEVIYDHSEMEQIRVKFIADQAKSVYRYKNIKTKLLQCCANIYTEAQC
jgi:hypothetical protein